jgi:metalloendopeptidase OMA1, mitochondrial
MNRRSSRLLRNVVRVALCSVMLSLVTFVQPPGRAAALGLPVLLTAEQEAELGRQVWAEVVQKERRSTDSRKRKRVATILTRINAKLAQKRTWTIEVFESGQVNAFAIPGGYIGVYTGMLDAVADDNELATVIAHEMAHVTERHTAKSRSKEIIVLLGLEWLRANSGKQIDPETLEQIIALLGLGADGAELAFSRSYELEADRVGLFSMARAKFDPRAAITFWSRTPSGDGGPEFLSTHPSDEKRVAALRKELPAALKLYRAA